MALAEYRGLLYYHVDEEAVSYKLQASSRKLQARDLQPIACSLKLAACSYFIRSFSQAASLFLYNDSRVCCIKAGLGFE